VNEPTTPSDGVALHRRLTILGIGQTIFLLLLLAFLLLATALGVVSLVRLGQINEETQVQSTRNGQILERLIDCTDTATAPTLWGSATARRRRARARLSPASTR
jgi:hypothetical protein